MWCWAPPTSPHLAAPTSGALRSRHVCRRTLWRGFYPRGAVVCASRTGIYHLATPSSPHRSSIAHPAEQQTCYANEYAATTCSRTGGTCVNASGIRKLAGGITSRTNAAIINASAARTVYLPRQQQQQQQPRCCPDSSRANSSLAAAQQRARRHSIKGNGID